ncbi:MAG: sigma-54 dependent transcriptional regulator [Bacteroidales bacterium]|nr:sigma-54 dependent transcriptional regulator [Bacteroidales bacterium]
MKEGNILIIDDNKSILSALEICLSSEFRRVTTLSDPGQILSELERHRYNLVLLDMNFKAGINTGNEGVYWLKRIRASYPDISVVMITAYGDVELAVRSVKSGATDFILKPWDNEKLIATLKSAVQLNLSRAEVRVLKEKEGILKEEINRVQKQIIGSSPSLFKVMEVVRKVAVTDSNVLITGENGTGKELVAREIHRLSGRSGEVFVPVDMGAITESLFESELFGHMKGSFTDARETRAGKFEAADKGTLFLDEIGNLSFHLQAKLLTALQERMISRIGSNHQIPVDIRLICSTNRDLIEMVRNGIFREDLLYRINTIHIEVPPLRERGEDISILAGFFLGRFAAKYGKPGLKIDRQATEMLRNYSWPGNVRELQHAVERAVILTDGDVLKPEDFLLRPVGSLTGHGTVLTLAEMERTMIRTAIDKHAGNLTAAAEELGITRQTIYNKVRRLK